MHLVRNSTRVINCNALWWTDQTSQEYMQVHVVWFYLKMAFNSDVQFMAVNAFWAVVHWVIWDGKVSTSQDILSSLLSPGGKIIIVIVCLLAIVFVLYLKPWPGIPVELSNPDQTSRLSFTSLSELSPVFTFTRTFHKTFTKTFTETFTKTFTSLSELAPVFALTRTFHYARLFIFKVHFLS